MNEASNFAYFCVVCGESFPRRLTGGIVAIKSKAIPMFVCPSCGPIQWEVMQICVEDILKDFLS
jgi:hypothetical protein